MPDASLNLLTSRSARRYHASLSIDIVTAGNHDVVCTNSISAHGCVVCGEIPSGLLAASPEVQCEVVLPFKPQPITIPTARAFLKDGDLHLRWKLSAADSTALTDYLTSIEAEPTADAKCAFLARENALIHTEIVHLDVERRRGQQFMMAVVVAYFAYTVAPYRIFHPLSVEMLTVYAGTGIWASVMILAFCMRHYSFVSLAVRTRALLYKALAGNRGWIFAHDPAYHAKSVFPVASQYDDSRAHRSDITGEDERYAQWISYRQSINGFMFLIQLCFVVGCVFFLSVLVRMSSLRDVPVLGDAAAAKGQLDLFDAKSFGEAFATFCVVPLAWIQLFGNKMSRFHKLLWEARKITAKRPNPRFPDAAFRTWRPRRHLAFTALFVVFAGYGICGLLRLWPAPYRFFAAAGHIFYSPLVAVIVLLAAVPIKAWFISWTLAQGESADSHALPIRTYDDKVRRALIDEGWLRAAWGMAEAVREPEVPVGGGMEPGT